MVRLRTAGVVLALIGAVIFPAAWLGMTRSALASHAQWDQGHDTFVVVLVEIGITPGPGGLCKRASPLEAATGNFIYTPQDLLIPALGPDIEVTRTYNSRDMRHGSFGHGWVFTYDVRLVETTNGDLFFAICGQGDGRRERFIRKADGTFKPPSHLFSTLVKNSNDTFTLREKDGTTHRFDGDGRLTALEDRNGNTMKFTYDATGFLTRLRDASGRTLTFSKGANGKIDSITDPAGRVLRYAYDAAGNLTAFTDALGNVTQYVYDAEHNLLQVIDPKDNVVQKMTYDTSDRVATFTEDGETWIVTYFPVEKTTTRRDASGNTWTFTYNDNGNITSRADPLGGVENFIYDAHFSLARVTDKNGHATAFVYDSAGNVLKKTDPLGNITTYTYEPVFNQVTTTTEIGRETAFSYDARGNLIKEKITAGSKTRTWNYTYDATGQLVTIDGPRTDVNDITAYTYDAHGNLETITNALGHVTRISHDIVGQPLRIKDANGLVTTLTYDAGGNVISRAVGGEITSYTYDKNSLLKTLTLPHGAVMRYQYDAFSRVTDITASNGDSIHYSLDVKGNVIREETFDSKGSLRQTRSYVYDSLSRMTKEVGAFGQSTQYAYDNNGNLTTVTDPLNHTTTRSYDALNRLIRTTDPNNGRTRYQYDPLDQLSRVTDPLDNSTDYAVDGLGNVKVTDSPDAGVTARTYDAAGNVLTETDARDKTTRFEYDALNLLTRTVYDDGTKETRTYEPGANGLELLTSIMDPHGSTRWTYDAHERITKRRQQLDGMILILHYSYDTQGRLTQMTYPSGKILTLSYDTVGRVKSIQVDGQMLLHQIVYQPFGAVSGWTWGNETPYKRRFDRDGKLTAFPLGPVDQTLDYDDASRLIGVVGRTSKTYGYDALGRLERFKSPSLTQTYSYDVNGNRLSLTEGAQTTTYSYTSGSSRLQSRTQGSTQRYTYDRAGNLINDGFHSFAYDGRGRMVRVTVGTLSTTYRYNGFGQRVAKISPGATTASRHFVYDEDGHLVGEYNGSGTPIKETIYLGNIPVAVLSGTDRIHYVYTDQINTPRIITDAQDTVVWRWESDPFGVGDTDEDPDRNGVSFTYNLRFPGQYFDAESGLHYNYFRDYDPAIGRYIQSDPIGLEGGVNLQSYVTNNPINGRDPLGLDDLTPGNKIQTIFEKMGFDSLTAQAYSDAVQAGVSGLLVSGTPMEKLIYFFGGPTVSLIVSDLKALGGWLSIQARLNSQILANEQFAEDLRFKRDILDLTTQLGIRTCPNIVRLSAYRREVDRMRHQDLARELKNIIWGRSPGVINAIPPSAFKSPLFQ